MATGKNNVPIGWESRTNCAWDPVAAVEGNPQANWMMEKMDYKYPVPENLEEIKTAAVPFGWENRTATKTLEDLSLSKTALEIAVAEIHLKEDATDLLSVRKYSQHSRLDEIGKKMKREDETDTTTADGALGIIMSAMLSMDQKMNAMQEKLNVKKEAEAETTKNAEGSAVPWDILVSAILSMDQKMNAMQQTLSALEAKMDKMAV